MDSIREKATQLGIDPGSSTNREDNLRTIANQLGLDESSSTDSYAIEKKLDELLAENNSQNENLNDEYYNDVPEEVQEGAPEQRQRFGEQEYNQARNENGKYDKDYYKNKQKDLDKELQNAKDEKARDWKYINPENKEEQDGTKKNSDLEKEKNNSDNDKEKQQDNNLNNQPVQDKVSVNSNQNANTSKPDENQNKTPNVSQNNVNPNKASGPVKADGSNTKNKSKWDKAKDNIRLANAKNNQIQNKLNNAKANMYKMSHPGEYLKDQATAKVKEVGKETASKAGKAVAKGAKEAGKAVGKAAITGIKAIIQFLAANPHVAAALAVIALILGIIIFLMAIAASNTGNNSASAGYYDYVCDFNQTTVAYTDTSTTNLEIGEFVKGVTYSYIKNHNLNNNQIKALMIAVKTNALSSGNYTNDNKNISISSGTMLYESYADMDEKLTSLYEDISGYLYLPNTYVDTITSLTSTTALDININNFVAYTGSYESILSAIYPDENLALYDLSDNCSYLIASGSDTYWWPIGSAETEVINGKKFAKGAPTSVNITSPFGFRSFTNSYHEGIDIGGARNSNIIASKSGTVTAAVDEYGEGICDKSNNKRANYVVITHDDGSITRYFHLEKGTVTVSVGDRVEQGQVIGGMGNSGFSCGVHLHFEIKINNKAVNPVEYVSTTNPRPVSIEGSSNKQTVCKVLLSKGYSKEETAALMANIVEESGFNPTNVGDSGTSYGLCQWHLGRWDRLKEYRPDSWKTIPGQIDYLKYELNNSYTGVNNYLKGNYTVTEKVTYFCMHFEVPANKETKCPKRAADHATSMMNYVNNGCQ